MVVVLAALSCGGLSGPVQAQGLETAALAALPAPRLVFSPEEMELAQAVSGFPGLADFYGANGLKPVFLGADGAPLRAALIGAIRSAGEHGLPAKRYEAAKLIRLDDAPEAGLATELSFARVFARWAHDVSGGVLDPQKVDTGIKRSVTRRSTGDLLRDFVKASDPAAWLAGLAPHDRDYLALQAALKDMSAFAAPAGTPRVPKGTWREGSKGEGVVLLRERLTAIGFDAAAQGDPALFDGALRDAVAAFQDQVGLPADGVAGPMTVARLNRGLGPEAKGIVVALERLRWMNGHDLRSRHVWVNLPSFTATIREDEIAVFSTRVVIGKDEADHETPEFSEHMKHVVANPRWNVPRSITVKEYLPRLQANRHAVSHIDVVDRAGNVISRDRIDFRNYSAANFPYRMRQKPSDDNALGVVKFLFPNPWNIYLHDTPTKHLFSRSSRAYSHGCIRVGRPIDLAHELLKGQFADPEARFSRALASGRESYLNLSDPLPVHLVYFTAYPDENGAIRRYGDIYGRDARVHAALVKAGL